jgi:hypothetical protein
MPVCIQTPSLLAQALSRRNVLQRGRVDGEPRAYDAFGLPSTWATSYHVAPPGRRPRCWRICSTRRRKGCLWGLALRLSGRDLLETRRPTYRRRRTWWSIRGPPRRPRAPPGHRKRPHSRSRPGGRTRSNPSSGSSPWSPLALLPWPLRRSRLLPPHVVARPDRCARRPRPGAGSRPPRCSRPRCSRRAPPSCSPPAW